MGKIVQRRVVKDLGHVDTISKPHSEPGPHVLPCGGSAIFFSPHVCEAPLCTTLAA